MPPSLVRERAYDASYRFIESTCTFLGPDETPLFPTAVAVERGDRQCLHHTAMLSPVLMKPNLYADQSVCVEPTGSSVTATFDHSSAATERNAGEATVVDPRRMIRTRTEYFLLNKRAMRIPRPQ
jgi:hypothetical protein